MSQESRLHAEGASPEPLDPWSLYDGLIAGIPEDVLVTDFGLGLAWVFVQAECGCGVAWTMRGGARLHAPAPDWRGRPLRELAETSKSWDFTQASLGVAALNAWYSRHELLDPLGAVYEEAREMAPGEQKREAFHEFRPLMAGKRVTVIGHFPHVLDLRACCAELTVLERNPGEGDTPDPACEYVLPHQDMVFSTGTVTINKTLPRILQLSRPALTVMTGPSVVPSPLLFEWGADVLAGSVVGDPEKTAFAVRQGRGMLFGEAVQMMRVVRPGLDLPLEG